ncbi:MAG: hypothetical protein M5U01_26575 [Ardenticatenaceae bacterium]|nr:hypothetical protein [Ardenticatenaceae bacterium]HBY93449.1 DNA topoisomerase [Chloroflexota bacterium]
MPERNGRMWRRVGSPEEGFTYLNTRGNAIRSPRALKRIASLVIPPAYADVRIAPNPSHYIQAVGVDSRGRTQYIYHPDFRAERDDLKYQTLREFALRLPLVRRRVNAILAQPDDGLSRDWVLSVVLRLLEHSHFRIGSDRYARQNKTYGLTTLRKKHLTIEGQILVFQYAGKRGKEQRHVLTDPQMAEYLQRIRKVPGWWLFEYYDESGTKRRVSRQMVNDFIKETMGSEFSSKYFRTWGGTLIAARKLAELGPAPDEKTADANIITAVDQVAEQLGNTRAIARKSYIAPEVLQLYREEGKTLERYYNHSTERIVRHAREDYDPDEVALLKLLGLTPRKIERELERMDGGG